MNQTNIPMEEKVPVLQLVYGWLDSQPEGKEFGPRDVQAFVRRQTNGKCNPQDGTITRYIRAYKADGGHVKNFSRSKSRYVIEDPDQWAEEILEEIEEAERKED